MVPKFKKPKRAKLLKKPKGRAPTEEEFKKILAVSLKWWARKGRHPGSISTKDCGGPGFDSAKPWNSGGTGMTNSASTLPRGDRCCDSGRTGKRPPGSHNAHRPGVRRTLTQDAGGTEPDACSSQSPNEKRKQALTIVRVIKVMAIIGRSQGWWSRDPKKGKKKYASAHDFRRAFGDRWALRVMPPVLMQLMRHESIETTMRYYVGRSVQATADVVWEAYKRAKEQPGTDLRDTLRDTNGFPGKGPKRWTTQIEKSQGRSGEELKEAPPGFEPGMADLQSALQFLYPLKRQTLPTVPLFCLRPVCANRLFRLLSAPRQTFPGGSARAARHPERREYPPASAFVRSVSRSSQPENGGPGFAAS